ncbi:hypothetical protein P3W45_001602 [Vairimorpha bombi]
MIIHNTKEGEYSEDLELLAKIQAIENTKDPYQYCLQRLRYITEDYKSWNILKLFDTYVEQLKLNERSIEFNPKSYDAWYHRYYTFVKVLGSNNENINKLRERDIGLVQILLKFDKRNLHCWNYINKLYKNNLDFVPRDATNYTYLHYCKSFNSVSCIFTDCYDHGMWLYYFTCKERELLKNLFYVRKYEKEIEIIFKEIFTGTIIIDNDQYEEKYFDKINRLENNNCAYNFVFNMEYARGRILNCNTKVWSNYINNVQSDVYDIYVIN